MIGFFAILLLHFFQSALVSIATSLIMMHRAISNYSICQHKINSLSISSKKPACSLFFDILLSQILRQHIIFSLFNFIKNKEVFKYIPAQICVKGDRLQKDCIIPKSDALISNYIALVNDQWLLQKKLVILNIQCHLVMFPVFCQCEVSATSLNSSQAKKCFFLPK